MSDLADMEYDVFANCGYGKLALEKLNKLSPLPENFRLYYGGWLIGSKNDVDVMELRGAEFRHAKTGKNKGKLCIMIKGTERTVFLSCEEVRSSSENDRKPK